jgi:DNA-binding beta-propeller fold protein YncE
MSRIAPILCALAALAVAEEYRSPAGDRPPVRRPGLASILPGGRMVEPLGRQFQTGPGPFGLAISPNGKTAVTANGGPNRYSLSVLSMSEEQWTVRHLVAKEPGEKKQEGDEDDWRSVFLGLAFEDDTHVFASEGNSGRVRRTRISSTKADDFFQLNQGEYRDSYSGDLAFDRQRGILYVADQANFRVAVFNSRTRKLLASAKVGRLPFKLALSPDGRRLYVTNIGMFEYSPIPGADDKSPRATGLAFPAFGFPSAESERGARRETERGPVDVPGVGDPNVRESNSLCVLDVTDPAQPQVLKFIRTGEPFGGKVLGGSSPSGVVASMSTVYVSNGNQDSITIIDAISLTVRKTILLRIPGLTRYRGILPIGLAIDLARNRLLVAEGGINAIGVVDLSTEELIAHLPAAWFPTAIALDQDNIFVASAKGIGTGPNATRTAPIPGSFQGEMRSGVINVFPAPLSRVLPIHTQRVYSLNGFLPANEAPAPIPDGLTHVVIIVKENRTYDEVFGDLESASNGPVNGAPELARFGMRGWVTQAPSELKARLTKKHYPISPNHHELARRYAFSDNFYVDSEVSVDGHHWIVGSYPNAWTESSLMAAYGGQKDFRLNSSAPGRRNFTISNSSLHPEEQLEDGAIWHHLERNGVSFRNFGEGFELAGADEGPGLKPTGARYLTNVPMPDPLYRNTSREYPNYNTNIPDQFRAQKFIEEIEALYGKTGRELPRLLFIHLPNDHIAKPRPEDGYPVQPSFVADNDYALGRIVEYLSKSRWWKNMAVFVTEDDAQGGVDHVDSHRTVLLVASPYAKRGYAARVNASFPAMLKTAFRILRIPPLNLFDASASDLAEVFTGAADLEPFSAIRPDSEIFVPEKAKDPLDPKPGPMMDDPRFLQEQHRQIRR